MERTITIGTRGSDLALWQAEFVRQELEQAGCSSSIQVINTQGDQDQTSSFASMPGSGFFTKAIEEALLNGHIDVAVHSHKDLETQGTPGLSVTAVPERYAPSDLLLILPDAVDKEQPLALKEGAHVGTASPRRRSQLLAFRPDGKVSDLRGNLPTRLNKLREGQYDAILLAKAGVERLGMDLSEFHVLTLDPAKFIPAPAQGALALQVREDDEELRQVLEAVHDKNGHPCVATEREVLRLFRGGCQLPVGVHCREEKDGFHVWASAAAEADHFPKRLHLSASDPAELPAKVVERLREDRSCSVLITREVEKEEYLYRALEAQGNEVHAQSLIRTQSLRLPQKEIQADWIFFSSKNGVAHFFRQEPEIPEGVKFGAIGEGTAAYLRQSRGIGPAFTGMQKDTSEVARAFLKQIQQDQEHPRVVFPISKRSARTVQKMLRETSVEIMDLPVYDTIEKKGVILPDTDVVIFTSPSNVRAYFSSKPIRKGQKVVAIGKTTARELEEHGLENIQVAYTPSQLGLVDAFYSL